MSEVVIAFFAGGIFSLLSMAFGIWVLYFIAKRVASSKEFGMWEDDDDGDWWKRGEKSPY